MAGNKRASASTNASFKKQKATVADKMVQLEGVLNANLQAISPSVPFASDLAQILEEVRANPAIWIEHRVQAMNAVEFQNLLPVILELWLFGCGAGEQRHCQGCLPNLQSI